MIKKIDKLFPFISLIFGILLFLFVLSPLVQAKNDLHGNVYFKTYEDYEGYNIANFEINPYFKIENSRLKYIYFKYGLNFKNGNHEKHYWLWGAEAELPFLNFITAYGEFEPIIMFPGNTSGLPEGERSTQALGAYILLPQDGQLRGEIRKETNGDWLSTVRLKNNLNINFLILEKLYAITDYTLFSSRAIGPEGFKPYMINVSLGGEFDLNGYTQRTQLGLRKYIHSEKNNWAITYTFTSGVKF